MLSVFSQSPEYENTNPPFHSLLRDEGPWWTDSRLRLTIMDAPELISVVMWQGVWGGGQRKLLSVRRDLGLELTSALQLCVVDTEVILPISLTDNMGCQHLKMLAFICHPPQGLSCLQRPT